MFKYYIMLLIATILLAGNFAITKLYQKRAGTSLKAGFLFNILGGLFTFLFFVGANGFKIHFSFYSILMASLFSLMLVSYTIIGFRILKNGSMALYTLFLMTGGMTVPFVWGLFFLDEEFSWLRLVGLCLLIFTVALTAFDGKRSKTAPSTILMCAVIFFLNGFTSIFSKMHQIEQSFDTVNTTEFVALTGLTKFALSAIAYVAILLIEKKKAKTDAPISEQAAEPICKAGTLIALVVISTVLSGVSYFFQLIGASNLPATVLYPMITGGSTLFSALVGILIFKEKPSKVVVLSVILCFIGTLMFL